jgi:hypothetical protein
MTGDSQSCFDLSGRVLVSKQQPEERKSARSWVSAVLCVAQQQFCH